MQYFFLISLFKSDKNLDNMAEIIGEEYRNTKDFLEFGVKLYSDSSGYGYGEQIDLIQKLFDFSNKFPNCVLGYYHFYWNCKCLTVYTINKGKVYIDKADLLNFKVGPYDLSTKYSFKNTQIPNNITCYLNLDYLQPFEKTFNLKEK